MNPVPEMHSTILTETAILKEESDPNHGFLKWVCLAPFCEKKNVNGVFFFFFRETSILLENLIEALFCKY